MADPRQIEQELREFLEMEDHIRKSEKLQYLMAIMNKHFELDKIDHMVTHWDFDQLMSGAKTVYANTTLPMSISCKEIHDSEVKHILMLETFIGYLNKHKLLKRLVKFDHRRNK